MDHMYMPSFDLFADESNFIRPPYKAVLKDYLKGTRIETPSGPNYQSCNKLVAEEFLQKDDTLCAFHLSEAVHANLRILAQFKEEQLKDSEDPRNKIIRFIKPIREVAESSKISKDDEKIFALLSVDMERVNKNLRDLENAQEPEPFHKKYLKFSKENNVENFQKILKEMPKEWTVLQLTAPYNPNENLKPFNEYRTEIDSLFVSLFTNDYTDLCDFGPITVHIPAYVTGEGVKPLFTELYSLLKDHLNTINVKNPQQITNDKHLLDKYWRQRAEAGLRLKSVINMMSCEWLGGWGCLLTGKLVDSSLKRRIIRHVNNTITYCGLKRLTVRQRVLLYNLVDASPSLSMGQIKPCIRRILTENGNLEDVIQNLPSDCRTCSKECKITSELCQKCLRKSFVGVHKLALVDAIRAISKAVAKVKDGEDWAVLRDAKRHPVILIVDEMLDKFPWECLPILAPHPVSRMENIHFLYSLYKLHQDKIVDGYYAAKCDVGRYVINPDNNLPRMEKRMTSFMGYWCKSWSGHVAQTPPPDKFIEYLTTSDIFVYCGHGDCCWMGVGAACGDVEGARGTHCVVLLAGCGSVELRHGKGREPPTGAHHHFRIAGSPMVIGMLWEVTDLEVDKIVSSLLSFYVPSDAPVPWPSVGKTYWSRGELDMNVQQKLPFTPEPELLRAVSAARAAADPMTANSVVARGLPMRIL